MLGASGSVEVFPLAASSAAKGGSAVEDSVVTIVEMAVAVVSGFGLPLPIHCAERIATPKLLGAGPTFSAYSFASRPLGKRIR